METIEELIVLNIIEYSDFDAIITCVKENGDHLLLRAKGFFKEKSRNILKFKELSKLTVEYFKSKNDDYKNWGLLKTGELIQEIDLDTQDDLKFKEFLKGILLQNYKGYNFNHFNLISTIIKYKNQRIIDQSLLKLFFLTKNLETLKIKPIINRCSICSKPTNIKTFSFTENGLICKTCFDDKKHLDLELNELKAIISLLKIQNIKNLINLNFSVRELSTIKELISDYYKNELGYFLEFY